MINFIVDESPRHTLTGNFIAPYEEPLRISSNRPTRVYHLTHRGHGYLDAYMTFKRAVEGL